MGTPAHCRPACSPRHTSWGCERQGHPHAGGTTARRGWGCRAWGRSGHGSRPEAHLGIAASNLHDPVADGQEQFHDAVGVPILGLHQGLAQGQPHVMGQEVLTVLLRGPASPRRCPQQPAGRRAAPSLHTCLPAWLRLLREGLSRSRPGVWHCAQHTVGTLIR